MSESSPGDPDVIVSQQNRDCSHGGPQQPTNPQGRGAQQANRRSKKFVGDKNNNNNNYDTS